jgi:replicative DNA helicase
MEPHTNSNIATLSSDDDGLGRRSPPANLEAEQALLAAILANNSAYEKVSDFLQPLHFADSAHGRIYAASGKLIERGQIANAVTLKNVFEADGELSAVGGWKYLAELERAEITIINVLQYGQVVHDLYMRRELINLGHDVVVSAFDHDLEVSASDQIEAAEERLYNMAESGRSEGGFRSFSEALTVAVEMAEAAHRREGALAGVATGFLDLDNKLGGLHPSDLLILAGRPGMGKTALATNMAFNAATLHAETDGEEGAVVGIFSLEMSAEQLATRILSERTSVPSEKIRNGTLGKDDFDKVLEASYELERLPLYIDDTPAISVGQLRTRARRLKRTKNLSMIIVDYLQLMRPTAGRAPENRVQEISDISRGLKAIAKELDLPVVALSQLSRAVEQREEKRPQLADLRESGSIEQDADVVMFVYREEYYLQKAEPTRRPEESDEKYNDRFENWRQRCEESYGKSEVIIAKQRHGPTGTIRLHFHGATTRFSNFQPEDHLPEQHY